MLAPGSDDDRFSIAEQASLGNAVPTSSGGGLRRTNGELPVNRVRRIIIGVSLVVALSEATGTYRKDRFHAVGRTVKGRNLHRWRQSTRASR